MTQTPDPTVAALAVQLAGLKDTLGQARDEMQTAKQELAARIDQLASDLAAQAGHNPKGPAATFWPTLDADAQKAAMALLAEWVAVMRQWHPSYFDRVAACWASHPEVVIELHNVMTEFTRIYRRENPPLADAILLYDRWLPGMLRRCADVMKTCGPTGCARQRQAIYDTWTKPECVLSERNTTAAMTDRIAIDPHPGLTDRIAEALFPWLRPSPAALERQHELTEPEAGL